jgi:pSer/pThr/pTyr-binding forkhead associated (FHA) protein
MMKCPNCGRENADNFNFCLDCGYDLKAYREQAPAPPAAAAPEAAVDDGGAPTESMSASEVQAVAAQTTPAPEAAAAPAAEPTQPPAPAMPQPAPAPAPAMPAPEPAPAASVAPVANPASAPDAVTQSATTQTGQAAAPAAPEPAAAPAPPQPAASTATAQPAAPAPAAGGDAPCPSCGNAVPASMKFCGHCGYRLDGDQPAAAPAGGGGGDVAGRTMFMHAADVAAPVERMCKLVTIDQSGQEGMTFTLKSGETLCGRVNGIILFFDDPYVSPTHCRFQFQNAILTVLDEGSLNGIYRRLNADTPLADGDFLRIGRQLFRFEALSSASSQVERAEGDDAKIWGSPAPAAFGRLVQILEDGRTGEIRLLTGDACNLGREQGEIVFPTDGFISGRHCTFHQQNGQAFLKDVGSSNGTYVRIRERADLGHGEFLLIGNQMLRVEVI